MASSACTSVMKRERGMFVVCLCIFERCSAFSYEQDMISIQFFCSYNNVQFKKKNERFCQSLVRNVGHLMHPYLGKATAGARAVLPSPASVCDVSLFTCCDAKRVCTNSAKAAG